MFANRCWYSTNNVKYNTNLETIKTNENLITVNGNNYLETMKSIQKIIIKYLKDKDSKEEEEIFSKLIKFSDISNDNQVLKEMLHLLSTISTNHYRNQRFFNKIEKILNYYKESILDMPNQQLFKIFKKSKRILLFLFKQKFLIPDSYIFNKISKSKYNNYLSYFYSEFKSFMTIQQQNEIQKQLPDNELYEKYRQEGENENYICKLIRNDSIIDFVTHITRNPKSLSSKIQPSIYETNSFLINKTLSLFEYAAFYGSIQIFQYLINNNIEFSSNLLTYAIHGKNEDIIHLLENQKIESTTDTKKLNISYQSLYLESIKCHHNKIAKYFYSNYIQDSENNEKSKDFILFYYENYNYQFIPHDLIIKNLKFLCKYDYLYYFYYHTCQNLKYVIDTLLPPKNQSNWNTTNEFSYLIYSIKKGNCELVKLLLNINGIDPNVSYTKYFNQIKITTPSLILAIENGNDKIVDMLLASQKIKPNINKIITYGALARTYQNNNSDKSRIDSKSALQIAFETNNLIIFEKLLNNDKIDVNNEIINKDISGKLIKTESKTILHLAIEMKNKELYSKLLANRNDININKPKTIELSYLNNKYIIDSRTPLYMAINSNSNLNCNEIADDLISNDKININSEIKICNFVESNIIINEKNIFHLAVEQGNLNLIEKLISTGIVDINKNEITKFFSYLKNQNYILTSRPPLHIAILNNNCKVVRNLLEYKKCNINSESYEYDGKSQKVNKSSLFISFEKGSIDVIKHLLQNESINVNEKTIYTDNFNKIIEITSPFYKAISNKNPEQVKLLLERSDLEINEKYVLKTVNTKKLELTPLLYAVKMQNIEIIKMLMEADNEIDVNANSQIKTKSSSLNQKTIEELTALQYAIKNNYINIVKFLLNQSKIDVNTITVTKKSTNKKANFERSTINSNRDVKKSSNFAYNKQNENKQKSNNVTENERIEKNALSIAIENKNEEIVSLLLMHKKININKKLIIKKSKDDHSEKIIKSSEEKSMLNYAAISDNESIIQNLLNKTNIRPNEITNLHMEISNQDDLILYKENQQMTALTTAIMNNKLKSVQCFLDCEKIDPNLALNFNYNNFNDNKFNNSIEKKYAFHIAIENDFTDILNLMIQRKNVDLCKKFIKKEYTRSTQNKLISESIIYFAVKRLKIESLKSLLLSPDIDINDVSTSIDYSKKIKETRTAFQYANKLDKYDIIKLLEEKNAKSKIEIIAL